MKETTEKTSPAPWAIDKITIVEDSKYPAKYCHVIDATGKEMALVMNESCDHDAHLMASAPELLEALKYQLARPDVDKGFLQDIISKVERSAE